MDAARAAERRRSRRLETRRLVVTLAVSQRRGYRPKPRADCGGGVEMELSSLSRRNSWVLPPVGAEDGRYRSYSENEVFGVGVHLDEAAVLNRIYDFL